MSFFALIDLISKGPPPAWKPGVMSQEEFAQEVARIHTQYRKLHNSYALRINEDLCAHAVAWAEHLSKSHGLQRSKFRYRGTRVAENISMKCSPSKQGYTPQEICDQWYNEVRNYEFGVEPVLLASGHFTNMVWRNSTEIGVGRATGRDGRCVVVVCYFPPGNVIGQFTSNVLARVDAGRGPPFTSPATNTARMSSSNNTGTSTG